MNRLFERILDNYFSKKVDNCIKQLEINYYLDFKHIYRRNCIIIYVKKKKYNTKEYVEICTIRKRDGALWLCKIDELRKEIIEFIKVYDKEY